MKPMNIMNKLNESVEDTKNMQDWKDVCQAFCKKIGAELLFVNSDNFGYETKDGQLVHMYADELEKYLKTHNLNESYAIVEYYDDKGYPIEKIVNGSNPKNVETKVQRIADRYEVYEIRQASADVANSEYLNSLGKGVLRKDTFNSKFEEPTFESSQATLDTSRIADFIKRSVNNLTSTDYTNCRYNLDDTFALFVGWSDGYDENATVEEIFNQESPTWRINAGIKIRNDYDWADYDFLNFPWYENGEVFDCSLTIDKNEDYEHDARYFVAEYKKIKEEYEAGQLLIESAKTLKEDYEPDFAVTSPVNLNTGVLPVLDTNTYGRIDDWGYEDGEESYEPDFEDIKSAMVSFSQPIIEEYVKQVIPSASVKVNSVHSPKYYNFEGDEVDFTVSFDIDEYNKVEQEVINNPEFNGFLKEFYSDKSGFISYLADNVEDFPQQDGWKKFVQVVMFKLKDEDFDSTNDRFWEDVRSNC